MRKRIRVMLVRSWQLVPDGARGETRRVTASSVIGASKEALKDCTAGWWKGDGASGNTADWRSVWINGFAKPPCYAMAVTWAMAAMTRSWSLPLVATTP